MQFRKRGSCRGSEATLNFLFTLGFWIGLITLYLIQGRRIRRFIHEISRIGNRHYMPYYAYEVRHHKNKDKRVIKSILSWIAIALIILGAFAMFGAFE